MSVAFRRDCDEEHLEPKFELPIPPGPNLVTRRGFRLIERRADELEQALAGKLDEEQRKILLRDARYWRSRLASAQLAPVSSGDRVAIGTQVRFDQGGEERLLAIVGHDESDPAAHRLSFLAPLARALLGSEVGEEVDLPGVAQPVTIIAILVANEQPDD